MCIVCSTSEQVCTVSSTREQVYSTREQVCSTREQVCTVCCTREQVCSTREQVWKQVCTVQGLPVHHSILRGLSILVLTIHTICQEWREGGAQPKTSHHYHLFQPLLTSFSGHVWTTCPPVLAKIWIIACSVAVIRILPCIGSVLPRSGSRHEILAEHEYGFCHRLHFWPRSE